MYGLKVDFDVLLTEVATGLYKMMARKLPGYEGAKGRQIFRHFLDTPAQVDIVKDRVEITLPKRAHNPLLIAAGFGEQVTPIPWWEGHRAGTPFSLAGLASPQNYSQNVRSVHSAKIQARE